MPTATPLLRRGLPYVPPCLLAVAGAVSIYSAHGGTVQQCPSAVADPRADPGGHHSVPIDEVHRQPPPCSATGAHAVRGCISTSYWRDHGGPSGELGYPTTEELAVPGGRASYFTGTLCGPERGPGGSGSAIFAHGAEVHAVKGCVFAHHLRRGGPAGPLGLPVSDEIAIPGGTVTYFAGAACGAPGPDGEGSAIYAGPSGIHDVQGCIYARYRALGGPGSALGFPTSDEMAISGGRVSHFQFGYIVSDGACVNVVYD